MLILRRINITVRHYTKLLMSSYSVAFLDSLIFLFVLYLTAICRLVGIHQHHGGTGDSRRYRDVSLRYVYFSACYENTL